MERVGERGNKTRRRKTWSGMEGDRRLRQAQGFSGHHVAMSKLSCIGFPRFMRKVC